MHRSMNSADFLPRTITLLVALATLASNVISSVLFSQLPDDPFHLASNFRWYLHFANVLSVFGFLGSLRVSFFSVFHYSSASSRFPSPAFNSGTSLFGPTKTWKDHRPNPPDIG